MRDAAGKACSKKTANLGGAVPKGARLETQTIHQHLLLLQSISNILLAKMKHRFQIFQANRVPGRLHLRFINPLPFQDEPLVLQLQRNALKYKHGTDVEILGQ